VAFSYPQAKNFGSRCYILTLWVRRYLIIAATLMLRAGRQPLIFVCANGTALGKRLSSQIRTLHMPSREVLICLRVDEAAIPPAPSFNCQCDLCGARIWVPHNSPLEPARMCGACGTAQDAQVSQPQLH